MNNPVIDENSYKNRTCQNTKNLRNWTAAWVVCMAITAFAPKYLWEFNNTLSIISVILSLAVGIGMLLSNRRYLRDLDEMQQKILLNAMALALGVALVFGLSFDLLEDIKLIDFQPEISHLVFLICFTYMAGIIFGQRNYQ